jgi:hypothetical protein
MITDTLAPPAGSQKRLALPARYWLRSSCSYRRRTIMYRDYDAEASF